MAKISILGGTGYAGAHIAAEAVARGHAVTSYSRSRPDKPVHGVEYRIGSATDPATLAAALDGADIVISALAARGDMSGKVRPVIAELAAQADAAGVRIGVIGGAGSLYAAEGGPLLADTPDFPEPAKPLAREAAAVLEDLKASPPSLDWFLVSPAAMFSSRHPGQKRGTYRLGGDLLLTDTDGKSYISGQDFAVAMVDEIESHAHSRARFTVAY